MCLIVDNDVAHRVLLRDSDPDFGLVHSCIFEGQPFDLKLYLGGKLTDELVQNDHVRRILVLLDQLGRTINVDDNEVKAETERLNELGICRANDTHVIALARISKARLVCTNDRDLQRDFKDGAVLSVPRGKVYKRTSHRELLRKACKCK